MRSPRIPSLIATLSLAGAGACTSQPVAVPPPGGPTAGAVRERVDALLPALIDGLDAAAAEAAPGGAGGGAAADPTAWARAEGVLGILAGGAAGGAANGGAIGGGRASSAGARADGAFARLAGAIASAAAPGSRAPADGARPGDAFGRLARSPNADLRGVVRAAGLVQRARRRPAGAATGETAGAAAARWLDDHVFTDEAYDRGAFAVPAELVCADDGGAIDPGCAQAVAGADLAIEPDLRSAHGLGLTLVAGADRAPILTVDLEPQSGLAIVDLGAAAPVLTALGGGDGGPALDLSGAIEAGVALYGDADASVTLGAITPIHVGLRADPGAPALALDVAAAAPALALRLDGPHATTTLTAAIGDVKLTVPSGDVHRAAAILDLPGLTFTATQPVGESLSIDDLSLGDRSTQLLIDGRPALTLDLDRDDGRRVRMTVDAEADTGATDVDVAPRFDLRLDVDWAVLGAEPPAVSVTRVLLDAADHQHGAVRLATDAAGAPVTEVLAGRLTIETDPAGAGGTFTPGQCVAETDGAFHAVDCP